VFCFFVPNKRQGSRAATRDASLQGTLRRHWNIFRNGASKLRFTRARQFVRQSSAMLVEPPQKFIASSVLRPKYFSQHPIVRQPSLSLSSSWMRDQVSHPYKRTFKIILLYILKFKVFWHQMAAQEILHRMVASVAQVRYVLSFFPNAIWFLGTCPKYLN